jgi:putative membrane protein
MLTPVRQDIPGVVPYCGPPPSPEAWLGRWNLDPILLAVTGGAVLVGIWLWRSRKDRTRAMAQKGIVGTAILLFLFISPFCALTTALFSGRVAHHILMVALAAPLLAGFLRPFTPVSVLVAPGVAATLKAGVFWLWHIPPLYIAAYDLPGVYWAMQTSLLAAALLFWASVCVAARVAPLSVLLALLATVIQMGLLGALLTFAPAALYLPHIATTPLWGLSPLEDQQLGGALMWVPGALPYFIAAVALVLARPYRPPLREGKLQ